MLGPLFVLNTLYTSYTQVVDNYFLYYHVLMAGYFSHLILDTLNPSGIMWLWPFSRRRFKLARIRTGSFTEVLVLMGLALVMVTIIF